MKKDILEGWIAALESGDYEQGRYHLRTSYSGEYQRDGYCCLGVLCDLAQRAGVGEWSSQEGILGFISEANFSLSDLPSPVKRWADINPTADESNACTLFNLSYYNDTGKSFKYIAELLKTHGAEL